jgi:intracellular sulfur oxidation DsrE/DsrF family protein
MKKAIAGLVILAMLGAGVAFMAKPSFGAEPSKPHRIAIQVDQNDPAVMNLALNNASNLAEYYEDKGESVQIEVVAYGPGLNMLRDDTSPVKARISEMAKNSFPSVIKFSACGNTKAAMERQEGHPIPIVADATVVPSGVVRLSELQEQGWSYLKP